ncbi:sulfur carrier protein ThiS [Pseudobacteriovorax antillogorgiicola]|uniref:Sulfur carrier protein n=1 Tax=Pseudobacteriovorax antillogorgiicola TaxID=1513793 RepID=A0A1Y6BT65_9BACT|nr:sulfur carrier protein ThiS [Pseudobacteriovorax antillogorgiicola]TCS53939.1 sulfur carrier protein [Pseudobacteriovorax antillogorgiicola]SMF20283.1 sulfur carrier protein [Pseudobacteriovorax antillogorgiicola]
MNIMVNGKAKTIDQETNVSGLLEALGYKNPFVAVAINHQCVPRSSFATTEIKNNDDIEILAPMSGG